MKRHLAGIWTALKEIFSVFTTLRSKTAVYGVSFGMGLLVIASILNQFVGNPSGSERFAWALTGTTAVWAFAQQFLYVAMSKIAADLITLAKQHEKIEEGLLRQVDKIQSERV